LGGVLRKKIAKKFVCLIIFRIFVPKQSSINVGTMKPNLIYTIVKSLSAKLSLWVVLFVSILFAATFSLMFYYARQAVREESIGRAEDILDKFEIVVGHKLHEKEVVAKQTHWFVEQNLNDTTEIVNYIQQILANEPEIIGIAAAFVPGFYADRGDNDYMIYYHRRKGRVVRSERFANASYQHQQWYEEPLQRHKTMWTEPREDYRTDDEPIITYSIPLCKNGQVVGVYGVDISLYWLSMSIQALRPLPNVYGAMMTRSGAFIIHPDTSLLRPRAMFRLMEQYPEDKFSYTAYRMLAGEHGTEMLTLDGTPCLLAYKPYEKTHAEIEIVCPEDEIMGHYNYMIPLMVGVVVLALIAIIGFCSVYVYRELNPLRTLEKIAKHIKNGHYDVAIRPSNRQDEVGSLTNSFIAMQKSINEHLDEIERNNQKLVQQNLQLTEAHLRIQKADKVKTAFLQNMTDQMGEPVNEISRLVNQVRQHHEQMTKEEVAQLANQVDAHTQTVTNLLSKLLEISTKKQEDEA